VGVVQVVLTVLHPRARVAAVAVELQRSASEVSLVEVSEVGKGDEPVVEAPVSCESPPSSDIVDSH